MSHLFTKAQHARLLANGLTFARDPSFDPEPVVKLFTPDGSATWLLVSLDADQPDVAFALCDLGFGSPELGSLSIAELERVRGRLGLRVERDRFFVPSKPIGAYLDDAISAGRITV